MGLKKKKLGDRVGGGLMQLKGVDDSPQVFSIISGDILSYVYHYDDVFKTIGKFMCTSEEDEETGKVIKKNLCCKTFKKRVERILIPVIHYEGTKKSYRKIEEGKCKYLSITGFKYNDLLRQLDEAGFSLDDVEGTAVDIILKAEDAAKGKIQFQVIEGEDALWKDDKTMKKDIKNFLETWEEDVVPSIPVEYSEEELARLIKEAEEEGEEPEGVEKPKKKSEKEDIPKSKKNKAKVEKDLDDDLDEDDDEEDEKPAKSKKKKSLKEQLEEEDLDNEELDEDEEESEDDDDLDEDDDEEDEKPAKSKKKKKKEDDEDDDEEDDD